MQRPRIHFSLCAHQKIRERQTDCRYVGHKEHNDQHRQIERHKAFDTLLHRNLSHGAARKQRSPHRRRAHADRQVAEHHHAELDRIHAKLRDHRKQHRGRDDD